MQAALLLGSDGTVSAWEFEALEIALAAGLEIPLVLHCTNDRRPPLSPKNAAYYALAVSGRLGMSTLRKRDVTQLLPSDVKTLHFDSEWEGAWQSIPDNVAEKLHDIDVVVKFGMNLLKDPENLPITHGVISYHHGDPAVHRGRPAGFYELSAGEATMGVIVQKLSNTLDGGEILAKAYSRVAPTSYKTTLNNAFALGTPLLAKAIRALKTGTTVPNSKLGPNHRLPTNGQVLRTCAKMGTALLRRGLYGAFQEKRWNIAFVPEKFDPEHAVHPALTDLQPLSLPRGYTFAADPCADHNGRLFAEVMHSGTGKGEIFAYEDGHWRTVDLPVNGGHLSYPQVIEYEGSTYIFPEMADVGPPTLFELNEQELTCTSVHQLAGFEDKRLVDGTLLQHEGHWYLFGGQPGTEGERLDLWVGDSPMGPWSLHPGSPISLDPRTARMGGPIIHANARLYRVGQDGSVGYGQGATINRIEELTPTDYQESRVSSFTIKDAFGPHTILPTDDGYWLDYYTDKTTPLAGVRRIKGRLK